MDGASSGEGEGENARWFDDLLRLRAAGQANDGTSSTDKPKGRGKKHEAGVMTALRAEVHKRPRAVMRAW